MSTALQTITNHVYEARDTFHGALCDNSLNFEREAGFAIQILTANDYISKLAVNGKQSVVDAVTNVAAIGISLNPAKKQAYLVPRKGKICLDISYMGLIDLAVSAGSVLWAQADLVYQGDAFTLNGFDRPPTHSYNPFSSDRGPMVGAYAVVKTSSGDYLTETMSRGDIDAIKNRSESVKAGKSSPWDTDYGEMAKKTVVKRGSKYWPKTARLDAAIHHLNTDGGEGLAQLAGIEHAAVERPALPDYPQSAFDKNLAQWRGIVLSGRKTPDELISMAEKAGKGAFTEAQRKAMRDLAKPQDITDVTPKGEAASEQQAHDDFVAELGD
jgi:recombination protein RecT